MVVDAGATISAGAFQDAAFTSGDAADVFSAIGVHSVVMNQMVKQDLIEYLRDSNGRIILATYLGKPVFMDDSLVYGAGRYLSVFFGQGAFGYGEGTPAVLAHVPTRVLRAVVQAVRLTVPARR